MSEISEEEDALLARLLLNTDLVSEENVEMVRELKDTFREQGVKVSIVDLMVQSGFLSRSDLNSLRAMVEEEAPEGESLMPPRFDHPFLTQKNLAEQAKEKGVITEDTYQRVKKIQELFDENGVSKAEGEILVEQGFVEPLELDFDEESSEEESTFDISAEEQVDVSSMASSPSADREADGGSARQSSVISELDRYVMEELVDRGRLDRSQIPDIVKEARQIQEESSGSTPVQEVLRERGILHPSTESEVLTAAMDRREESQQWGDQFTNMGPMAVTVVLIICVIGVFFLTYGSSEDRSEATSDSAVVDEKAATTEATTDVSELAKEVREEEQTKGANEKEQEEPSSLLTFRAKPGGYHKGQRCECEVRFDGQQVTTVSGTVEENGTFEVKVFSSEDRNRYVGGVYVLHCAMRNTPGVDFPVFPLDFRNPLEEQDPPGNVPYEALLNGELWDFVTVSALPSPEDDVGRKPFALGLRNKLTTFLEQWNRLKSQLSDDDPNTGRLRSYGNLYSSSQKIIESLNSVASTYRSFYYPNIREIVRKRVRTLPRVVARVIIRQRQDQDMNVPNMLREGAGNGSGGSISTVESIAASIQEQVDRLPGRNEEADPFRALEPVVTEQLQKLGAAVQTLSYIRDDEDLRRRTIEKYKFVSVFKYMYAQIALRSILLDRTSQLKVFEESTAERMDGLSKQVRKYLSLVLVELADTFDVDLPSDITNVEGSADSVEDEMSDLFDEAGVEIQFEGANN